MERNLKIAASFTTMIVAAGCIGYTAMHFLGKWWFADLPLCVGLGRMTSGYWRSL